MSDLISREKTLYRLATSAVYYFDLEEDQAAHNWAMHVVSNMPSEEPKRGEWEVVDESEPRRYGCNRCKRLSWDTSNFCPNCGADMREREGEW